MTFEHDIFYFLHCLHFTNLINIYDLFEEGKWNKLSLNYLRKSFQFSLKIIIFW